MFTPKYAADDPGILFDLTEIERIRFRIENIEIMPKYERWIEQETFIRTAYSSTMVENKDIPEQEMEKIAKQAPVANLPETRPDVFNYGRALEFIDFITSDNQIVIDESVIRQIHWTLMKGIKDEYFKPGQYRTEPNWIEHEGIKVYDPPFHVNVPMLMSEFSDWIKNDDGISPIIKAGVAHVHLVAIHPFVDGNGRTARLLATLLIRKYGYGFRRLLSIDNYYHLYRDKYIDALRNTLSSKYADHYDCTKWLGFFTRSLHVQMSDLEAKLTDWRMFINKAHADWKPFGLSDRQVDGLMYAMRVGSITRKDYIEIAHISPLTATRDLADMVQRGLLTPMGNGRNRMYLSKPPVDAGQQAQLM
jgi:Fic family protein